ncbi:hypothetical protein GGI09_003441 [Coemansia sp. S100]|nr:hypothetical protein GGI09_003441 [Coemansia sp. S100]
MHVSRGKQRGGVNNGRPSKGQATEQFPELLEGETEPPPYYSASGESSRVVSNMPVFTIGGGEGESEEDSGQTQPPVTNSVPSDDRYYQPASFPGYTIVQLINSQGESQALLPRVGRHQRRRDRGSCLGRCCGHMCACLCFIFGALMLAGLLCAAIILTRQIIGSDWQCQGLLPHSDKQFSFARQSSLLVDSARGMTQTTVHLVEGNLGVRAVIEASAGRLMGVGVEHSDSALRLRGNSLGSWWWWQRGGCVRATLYVSIPSNVTLLKSLTISTGDGALTAKDMSMPVDLQVSMSNGAVQLHDLSISGSLRVSTTNGLINVTNVQAGSTIDLWSVNTPNTISNVAAPNSVTVRGSNAAINVSSLRSSYAVLHTTNGRISMHNVDIGDNLLIQTRNAVIEGDARAALVYARSSNAAVNIQLGGRLRTVAVDTTNGAVTVDADGFRGNFDVRTSNSRVAVGGGVHPIEFTESTTAHKAGVYGDPALGNITLTTSNAGVSLKFV